MTNKQDLISNTAPRSSCPIANTLDLVGDKWTLLIIRDMLRGKSKYGEFLDSGEGIPTNILASRLRALEAHGALEKKAYSEKPPRFEYILTGSGMRFGELVLVLKKWGAENISFATIKSGE